MKKIMFNDRYGLTDAVLSGRKTVTRRVAYPSGRYQKIELFQPCLEMDLGLYGYTDEDGWEEIRPHYKVGEVVAVAQNYRTVLDELENPANYCCVEHWEQDAQKRADYAGEIYDPGYGNKMFARADLMPHQIEILDVRAERLQDITEEDCLKEGIEILKPNELGKTLGFNKNYEIPGCFAIFNSPREAYAFLIDKINGRGTWERNPFVWRIEFKLVK